MEGVDRVRTGYYIKGVMMCNSEIKEKLQG